MVHRFARRWTDPVPPYVAQVAVLTAIYAIVAQLSLRLDPVSDFATFAWWLGDALGNLVVAPFVLNWATTAWLRVEPRRLIEALVLSAALLGLSLLVFGGDHTAAPAIAALRQPTTLLPLLIWAALRFG